jgi:urease accessory protein
MAMITSLHIETARRGNKTMLKKGYATHPLKIANITTDTTSPLLELMMMSSSPGILDGDDYRLKIELAANTSLSLQTQSYQRLFTMKHGASHQMDIFLQPGASFSYLPHPTVPHASSKFISKNKIYLSSGCHLTWGEVITAGRKINGEEFLYSRYHNLTEIYLHDRLVIRENLILEPALKAVQNIGQLESYTHQASMIVLDESIDVKEIIPAICEYLKLEEQTCCGVTAAPVNGVVIRMLGYKAEQLHHCLKMISKILSAQKMKAPAFLPS